MTTCRTRPRWIHDRLQHKPTHASWTQSHHSWRGDTSSRSRRPAARSSRSRQSSASSSKQITASRSRILKLSTRQQPQNGRPCWPGARMTASSSSTQCGDAKGPSCLGAWPRHIFQAEPNSALAHIYDGEWSYATDEQGRAVVNSDPAHWPIIVNWLSFGTVPKDPPAGLVSECKYWQLDGLIAALSPAEPDAPMFSVRTTRVDNNSGFSASTSVANFPQRLDAAASKDQTLRLPFKAVGREWSLDISSEGVFLHLVSGAALSSSAMTFALGQRTDSIQQNR